MESKKSNKAKITQKETKMGNSLISSKNIHNLPNPIRCIVTKFMYRCDSEDDIIRLVISSTEDQNYLSWMISGLQITKEKHLFAIKVIYSWACQTGQIRILEQLYAKCKLTDKDIDVLDAFERACKYNKLASVIWLYKKFSPAESKIVEYKMFQTACNSNSLLVARWLCEKYPFVKFECEPVELFKTSCILNSLPMAKWLLREYDLQREDCDLPGIFKKLLEQAKQISEKYKDDKEKALRKMYLDDIFGTARWLREAFDLTLEDWNNITKCVS
jgi:hypothetical protein